MAYDKRPLQDGVTIIDKALLDHIQDGIVEAHNGIADKAGKNEEFITVDDIDEICGKNIEYVTGDRGTF